MEKTHYLFHLNKRKAGVQAPHPQDSVLFNKRSKTPISPPSCTPGHLKKMCTRIRTCNNELVTFHILISFKSDHFCSYFFHSFPPTRSPFTSADGFSFTYFLSNLFSDPWIPHGFSLNCDHREALRHSSIHDILISSGLSCTAFCKIDFILVLIKQPTLKLSISFLSLAHVRVSNPFIRFISLQMG